MNSYHQDLREKVISYVESGHTVTETSKLFGVCVSSISRWRRLKSTTGSLKAVFVPRSPHKLMRKALVEYLEEHPDAFLREIAGHFKCGIETVRYTLLKLGITRKKVKEYKERDEKKREKFREAIKDIPKENLVYVDESGVDQYSYLEYGRAPRGKKISAKVSGRKFERQSIVAAQNDGKILAPFGYKGTCDTNLFNLWVEKILVPELKPGQIVIMDNASIHKSEMTKNLIEAAGCELTSLFSRSQSHRTFLGKS